MEVAAGGGRPFAGKEMAVYVCLGGLVDEGANGAVTYVGGNTRCVWISEGMGVREVRKVVETAVGLCLEGRKAWYNMKFDRRLLMPFENDGDLVSLMRGNDGHAYVYIAGVGGPSAAGAVGREQQQHRCQCEGHVLGGGDVGGAGSGTQLVQGNGGGEAASGKVVRVDAAHKRRRQSIECVVQVTSGSDRGDEESSHSESGSESDDDREAVVWARSGVEAEDYIRRRIVWKNVCMIMCTPVMRSLCRTLFT